MESLHAFFASLIALVISFTGSFHPSSNAIIAKPIATTATTSIMVDTAVTQATTTATTGQAQLSNATNTFYADGVKVRDIVYVENSYRDYSSGMYILRDNKVYLSSSSTARIKDMVQVNDMDPKTFYYIGSGYSKDSNSLFRGQYKIVFDTSFVDIHNLQVVHPGLVKDSKNIYYNALGNEQWKYSSLSNTPLNMEIMESLKDDPYIFYITKDPKRFYFGIIPETLTKVIQLKYLDVNKIEHDVDFDYDVKYLESGKQNEVGPDLIDISGFNSDNISEVKAFNYDLGRALTIYDNKNKEESLIASCFNGDYENNILHRDIVSLGGGKLRIGVYKNTGIDPCKEGYKSEKIRDDIVDLTKFQ